MTEPSKHPLLMDCYNLCQAIEACGASPELTNAVVRASDLMHGLEVVVDGMEAMTARVAELKEMLSGIAEDMEFELGHGGQNPLSKTPEEIRHLLNR